MGVRAIWRSALLSVAIMASAATARAQDGSRVAAATVLFDEGVRALDAGNLDEACQKLAKSQELAPSGGTLLALGECHERAGRVASAWLAYRGAAARAAAAGKSDAEASALAQAAKLEPKLARLTIRGSALVANVELTRDSTPVTSSELGVPVPVDPGPHEVRASAPGSKPWTKEVQVASGSQVTIDVPALEPDRTPPPPSPGDGKSATPDDDPGRVPRVLGITAAGLGGGALIGGSIFGALAISANDDGEAKCRQKLCSQEGLDLIRQASDRAALSTIFFLAGAALVAGGLALYFISPGPRKGAYLDLPTGTVRW